MLLTAGVGVSGTDVADGQCIDLQAYLAQRSHSLLEPLNQADVCLKHDSLGIILPPKLYILGHAG